MCGVDSATVPFLLRGKCTCSEDFVCYSCAHVSILLQLDFENAAKGVEKEESVPIYKVSVFCGLAPCAGRRHALSAALSLRLALAYAGLRQYEPAIELYESTLALYAESAALRKTSFPGILGTHVDILATLYRELKRDNGPAYKRALLWMRSFWEGCLEEEEHKIARSEYMIAEYFLKTKEFDEAESHLTAGLKRDRASGELKKRFSERCCQGVLGLIKSVAIDHHVSSGRFEPALELLQTAVEAAELSCDKCFEKGRQLETVVEALAAACRFFKNRPGINIDAASVMEEAWKVPGPALPLSYALPLSPTPALTAPAL
eukprot:tig00020538_g10329.t1